mgnify:CR=1 FL=1
MKSIIKINIDNTMENININEKKDLKEELKKKSNFKGNEEISEIYTWNKNVKAYGSIKGCDNKNIHKLPPYGISSNINNKKTSEEIELYGNIFIVCFNGSNITNYSVSEYGELHYILTTDDFKEYSNTSSSEEEEKEKVKKNNVDIINVYNDILLDEDLNEYK